MTDWTVHTLKEHFDALRADDKEAVQAALIAVKEENGKSERAAEKRFDLLNELRVGVATVEQLDAVKVLVSALGSRLDRIEGAGNQSTASTNRRSQVNGNLVGAGGLIVAILAVVFRWKGVG
jgi:hypothetical protein